MIVIPEDEKREQKTCSSYKKWILPSLASLALHVFGFNLANTALQIPSEIEQNRIERIETERKLEQILACTPNPQREVSLEEQSFIDSLVLDLQDKHLDSMSLGEYFVRSETFVHNRNIGCLEDTWLVESELKDFNDYRSMVLNEDFVNEENPVERSIQIAKFLHSGIYPYYEDDPIVKQLVNEHGNKVLDKPILFNPSNSGSSWFLKTKKGERSNCKSGTKWFAAITSEDPALEDKVYNLVFDNHILSVVNFDGTEYFFENTSDSPFPIEQDLSDNPARRPNEMFVIEYLVASGIKLELFPIEFQSWYEQKPKSGIMNINTDEYGLEAKVGARSKNISEELFNIPFSYPNLIYYKNSKEKIVALDLNYSQIDWVKVLVEYTKYEIIGDALASSYYHEQMFFLLDRVVESTSDPDIISMSKKIRSDFNSSERALLNYEVQYWSNPDNFSQPTNNYIHEEARLNYFLRKQREAHIEAILLDSNPNQVLVNQVLFDSSILDTTSGTTYNRLVFLSVTDQYIQRFHNYPEIPEVLDLQNKLVDTGLRLYTSEVTLKPILVLIKLGQISDPQINERIITNLVENPSEESRYALAVSASYYPNLLIFPEMYSILEERLNNDQKVHSYFCDLNFPTYSAEEKELAKELYDNFCNN